MNNRLVLRIFSTYLVIVILSFSVFSLFVHTHIKKTAKENIENELTNYGHTFVLFSKKDIKKNIYKLSASVNARLTLIDASGMVLADSEKHISGLDNHLNRTEIQEARLKGKGVAVRFSQTLRTDMLYIAVPVPNESVITGYIRLGRPLYAINRSIQQLYESLFTALFIVIPLSLIIALIFSYRLTLPIKAMEQYTERIRKGDASGILLVNIPRAFRQLAGNINYLVDELKNRIKTEEEEKGKLIAAFASMAEGVLILATDHKIEFCNQALYEMIGPQYGVIEGKTLMETFRNIELEHAFHTFRETRQSVSREVTLGDVKRLILEVSISPIEGLPGDEKTMIVFRDMTRLKTLENMRADFVANVTHEIRTPLTAILGYVETLRDGALENKTEAQKFLEVIARQAMRLNRLVEDLLTISKIELEEMKFHFERVFLHEMISNILPMIEPMAKAKRISVHDRMPEKLPPVKGDRDRMTQIFMNILDNAVKFTPEGGEVVLTATEAVEARQVIVRITDTGIGVPKDEISRLGERFYRVDKTRSREMGGTGLGLSIVKHLMAAHGGRMEIESQLGKGTTVSLFFAMMQDHVS